MIKNKLIIMSFFVTSVLYSQVGWIKTFGGAGIDEGYEAQVTKDGGYILVGSKRTSDNSNSNLFLVKTDSCGDSLWTKSYGGNFYTSGSSVKQTDDLGFIIAGFQKEGDSDNGKIILLKVNPDGKMEWKKIYDNEFFSSSYRVIITSNGGFLILGFCDYNIYDAYLIRTNSEGDTVWTQIIDGFIGRDLIETSDGEYIIAGSISDKITIIKVDSSGNILWNKKFEKSAAECGSAMSISGTHNKNFIITGTTNFPNGLEKDSNIFLIKIDSKGDSLWSKRIGLDYYCGGNSIYETNDKGFIITGYKDDYIYLAKTDSVGDTLWTKIFGGHSSDKGNYVLSTKDNEFIVAGTFNNDLCLIKTDSLGNMTPTSLSNHNSLHSIDDFILFQNYPNPFNNHTNIMFFMSERSKISINIYDVNGELIGELYNGTKEAGFNNEIWNAAHYPSGLYFIILKSELFVKAIKCILIK